MVTKVFYVICIINLIFPGMYTLIYKLRSNPSEDVQCIDSGTEPSSEKHEEKISNMISYTAKVKCKS